MLNFISVSIVVVFAIRGVFYYGQSYLVSYIGQRVVVDVREVMFRKFQRMPMAYFDRHQTGETMSYLTNDVSAIQAALVDNLIEMFTEGAILIGSIAMMLYLDWKLTLLTLVTVPLVGISMKIFGKKIKSTSRVKISGHNVAFAGKYIVNPRCEVICPGKIRNRAIYSGKRAKFPRDDEKCTTYKPFNADSRIFSGISSNFNRMVRRI